MSLIRDPATITKVGRQMMTAGGDITYTKATLYGQDISHLTKDQLESLTSIGSPLMTVPVGISDKSVNGSATTIVLEATFQNSNLKADLPYTAVGFFAKKGDDEKLVLVGVADPGAYLVATPPDGIATDALDIKVAISIGDAASVTAVVDPAGSVTPATLNGAINKATHDLTAQIDTKADKTTVESELAIKANSTDVDKKLATKANSSDVYTKKQVDDAFSSRDATIATKADKAVVDAEIAKIDFTPYAKTVDVDTKIKDVSDVIATKVGTDYSYSKAELDKKLLALSTDTSGKVDANQVATMIESKADKTDLDNEIKAVTDLANTKANTVDVDSKIKTVTDLANTKANSADVYTKTETDSRIDEAKNTVQSNLDSVKKELNTTINTKANSDDVYNKPAIDSAFNTRDNNINRAQSTADGAQTTANNALPKAGGNMNLRSTINWNGGGINDKTGNLGGLHWDGGSDTASIYGDQNANDNLDLVFDLGDDGSNHFSFRNKGGEVAAIRSNGHYTGTVDWGNVWGRPDVTPIVNGAAGDDLFAFKSNQIRLYPGNGKNCKNLPPASNTQWFTVQYVFENPNVDGVAIFRSPANEVWMVGNNGGSYTTGWTRLANSGDISNLQNIINLQNQTIQSLTTRLNNAENEIRYIKANYVEGRTFPASQEAQANSWENENPHKIAFITK